MEQHRLIVFGIVVDKDSAAVFVRVICRKDTVVGFDHRRLIFCQIERRVDRSAIILRIVAGKDNVIQINDAAARIDRAAVILAVAVVDLRV